MKNIGQKEFILRLNVIFHTVKTGMESSFKSIATTD